MTSETKFATGYTSMWREITPLSDGYWGIENMLTNRVAPPIPNRAPSELRGLVNELAFIAFDKLSKAQSRVSREVAYTTLKKSIADAVAYINRINSSDKVAAKSIDETCLREALQITLRLLTSFPFNKKPIIRPKFKGCGIISACEGDVVFEDHLFEIKAGDRGFRVSDLRQLLAYSALAYAANELNFSRLGLFNPRTGMMWSKSLDDVCVSISGLRSSDVLPRLVDHMQYAATSM